MVSSRIRSLRALIGTNSCGKKSPLHLNPRRARVSLTHATLMKNSPMKTPMLALRTRPLPGGSTRTSSVDSPSRPRVRGTVLHAPWCISNLGLWVQYLQYRGGRACTTQSLLRYGNGLCGVEYEERTRSCACDRGGGVRRVVGVSRMWECVGCQVFFGKILFSCGSKFQLSPIFHSGDKLCSCEQSDFDPLRLSHWMHMGARHFTTRSFKIQSTCDFNWINRGF